MSDAVIYVLDTNVLVEWISHYGEGARVHGHQVNKRDPDWAQRFCEENENRILIPDLVWAEFLALMLQKGMDRDQDYDQFRLWFRNQESWVQHLEDRMEAEGSLIERYDWPYARAGLPFQRAEILVRDPQLFDQQQYEADHTFWLKKQATLKESKRELERWKGKGLDGMDALIIIYANQIALDHPKTPVVLWSGDWSVCQRVPLIRQRHPWIAPNLTSFNSSYTYIKGRWGVSIETLRSREAGRYLPAE